MPERVWLERVCFLRSVAGTDDCIYIKHTKVADKTVPRGMYDFMTLRLHESYECD